jgi:crotonobetainyl-CoA:carnitine CoA-transferase CaiB-like acyl-CoA transferase
MGTLDGILVVDLTRVLAGPFCTMHLADMGADVVKIEEPGSGDDSRAWAPFINEWSTYFVGINRGKKSVALDLKTPAGSDVLRRLLARADVLIENIRPGSLEKLGFGYEAVKAWNPGLVYCSISGYGQTGPRHDLPGYDPIVQAESGLMEATGFPDGAGVRVPIALTDYFAGLYAHVAIMHALYDRTRTGLGQFIDIALLDSLFSTLSNQTGISQATGKPPARVGNDHPSVAPNEVFQAKDGRLMVSAANARLWTKLCAAIGTPGLAADARFQSNTDRLRNRDAMRVELEQAFSAYTVAELIETLRQVGVPCGRLRTVTETLADPQLAAREMVMEIANPELNGFKVPSLPIKLSRTPGSPARYVPKLGEHTADVLRTLGYSDHEITAIVSAQTPRAKAV